MANDNFWDHLFNAAGALLDAGAQARAEEQAKRDAQRAQRAPKAKASPSPVTGGSFASPPAAECCIAKRRVKKL